MRAYPIERGPTPRGTNSEGRSKANVGANDGGDDSTRSHRMLDIAEALDATTDELAELVAAGHFKVLGTSRNMVSDKSWRSWVAHVLTNGPERYAEPIRRMVAEIEAIDAATAGRSAERLAHFRRTDKERTTTTTTRPHTYSPSESG